MNVTTVDFETKGITKRPAFPPEPVGVAIMYDGKSKYMAWGHESGNNCTKQEAIAELMKYWGKYPICFHNAKFDIAVAHERLGLPILPYNKFEDTMLLAFLVDPFAERLGLKDLAQKHLGWEPEERDDLRDWIMANIKKENGRAPGKNEWGAYIADAPAELAGRYARADVNMTCDLYHAFKLISQERGMLAAYNREKKLLPILYKSEMRGIRVDTELMAVDSRIATEQLGLVTHKLCARVGDIDLDSGEQLADALEKAGIVSPDAWSYTVKGARKTGYNELAKVIEDQEFAQLFEIRGRLATITRTFLEPWIAMSESEGRIYTDWQQVRNSEGKGFGARTGRLSSTPNFQNVPKNPWVVGNIQMPYMRQYIIPDEGMLLLDRDYSQQELRLLAHYIGGSLSAAYQDNPQMDLHNYAQDTINNMMHLNLDRKPIKNTAFAILYGMSNGSLGELLGSDKRQAARLRGAYLKVMPGLNVLIKALKKRAAAGEPFRTWGGRYYWCEEPKLVNGRMMTFEYKMLNQLIQGSAADVTKEAVIRMDEACESDLLLTVHDQILHQAELGSMTTEMRRMKEAMESIECDVPMLSDGEFSLTNWGELMPYDDSGKNNRASSMQVRKNEGHADCENELAGAAGIS